MGNQIEIADLLKQFIDWVDKDDIDFLKKKDDQDSVRGLAEKLLEQYQNAKKSKEEADLKYKNKKDLNEFLDWFEIHGIGAL